MTFKEFFNGQKLNTYNKKIETLDLGHYGSKDSGYVKHTSFVQIDVAQGQRNGVSSVVQLVERLIEFKGLYIFKGHRWNPKIYVNGTANTSHGFGSKKQVLLIYRDFKGHKESAELYRTWDYVDFKIDLIGYGNQDRNFKNHEKLNSKPYEVRRRYTQWLREVLRRETYSEMSDLERGTISDDLKNLYSHCGIELIKSVPYTDSFDTYGVAFFKNKGMSFKIGFKKSSTYNSLPETLEVQFKRTEIKFKKLKDLKIEERGYYSHYDNMAVKPEHVEQVKKFYRKFKSELRGNSK